MDNDTQESKAEVPAKPNTNEAGKALACAWVAYQAHAQGRRVGALPAKGEDDLGPSMSAALYAIRDELMERSGLGTDLIATFDAERTTEIGCAYCGYRGEVEDSEEVVVAALRAHVEVCPTHPMRELEARLAKAEGRQP